MKFLEITKKLLKIKQKTNTKYTTNPFKENKEVTLIWINKDV